MSVLGKSQASAAVDLLLGWWLVLGAPLAWKKGSFSSSSHQWIGVLYTIRPTEVWMELPQAYLKELLVLLEPFCSGIGHIDAKTAERTACKAGRVAQVVPAATPFVGSFWGALQAASTAG